MQPDPQTLGLDPGRPLRSLGRLLRPYRGRLAAISAIFVVKDSPLWLLPVITGSAIDYVVAGGPLSALGVLAIVAAALLLQVYPTHILFTRTYMGIVRRIAVTLRNAIVARLQTVSIGYFGRTSAAVMQSKVVRDVENIELMFGQVGNPLGSAVVVFIGAITMTALSVPQFLPIYALTIPLGVGVWALLRKRSHRSNEDFRIEMEQYSRAVGDMATLMPITRAHGLENDSFARVAQRAEGVRSTGLSLDMVNGHFGALSWVLMQLLAIGCLLGAGALSISGLIPITAGEVVLLGTYFNTLTGTVMTVLNFLPIIARGRESMRSIAEVICEPDLEQNEGKRRVDDIEAGFRFEGVTVRYGDSDGAALDDVTFSIAPGETVAFVGASGSGKSTLMNVALGFVRPSKGRVLLDGADMSSLDLRTVRRRVAIVPQDSVLFEGTIRDNITYGLDPVPDETVRAALVRANAQEIIDALPQGWDTRVGQRGARLSGGQRQRISIARALIRNPRLLVLDEATSALDVESERKVQEALERLMTGRTTLVVAHRLSTIRNADRIVVLDRGRIAEIGSHHELLEREGRYRVLWEMQSR